MPLITRVLNALREDKQHAPASTFVVDYYVETPRGTRTRFNRQTGLSQIRMAMSESAVIAYLRKQHPGCTVIIQNLSYK